MPDDPYTTPTTLIQPSFLTYICLITQMFLISITLILTIIGAPDIHRLCRPRAQEYPGLCERKRVSPGHPVRLREWQLQVCMCTECMPMRACVCVSPRMAATGSYVYRVYAYACVRKCIYINACMCAYVYVYMYMCVPICVKVHVYVYVYAVQFSALLSPWPRHIISSSLILVCNNTTQQYLSQLGAESGPAGCGTNEALQEEVIALMLLLI